MFKAVVAMFAVGCSAPATTRELRTAEARARAGDTDGEVAAYRIAQGHCEPRMDRRTAHVCAESLLGEAEALDRANRIEAAIEAYLAIPQRTGANATTSAIATYRAGALLLRAGRDLDAWTALWRVVTDWPDEPIAADALSKLVADGRNRDAAALAEILRSLADRLVETAVADNLDYALADIEEHELARLQAARHYYDAIVAQFPKSGLADDAHWHAARLSRLLGDPKGTVTRLRAFLATREVSYVAGSYFSIWLDDAQLELGRVLRDELRDPAGAIAAFRRLPHDYPDSILRDDALYELAMTQTAIGDAKGACATLAKLRAVEPPSKHLASTHALEASCPGTHPAIARGVQ